MFVSWLQFPGCIITSYGLHILQLLCSVCQTGHPTSTCSWAILPGGRFSFRSQILQLWPVQAELNKFNKCKICPLKCFCFKYCSLIIFTPIRLLHLKNYFHTFLLFYVDCENGCLYLFAGLLNNKMQMNLAFYGHSGQNSSKNNFIFKSDMIYWNCAYFCPVVHGRNPGPNYYAYLLSSVLN